jgi:hypothetical protein
MISVLRIMNRTTTVIVALIAAASLSTIVIGPQQQALAWHHPAAAAAAAAVPKGSWLTAPYGDSPDALFFCGAALRQFTGIGAYGCGNGPEGGQVYPWGIAYGSEFPIGIPRHWAFSGWGCGGFGCGGGFG